MLDKIKRPIQFRNTLPDSLKRTTPTTPVVIDSSSASLSDGADPDRHWRSRRNPRQRENQRKVHHDDGYNPDCVKTRNGNRRRRLFGSSVSFGSVTVREYNRALGDWWDLKNGLALGWEYIEHPATPLQDVGDDAKKEVAKLRRDQVKKLKAKITGWLMVSKKKRRSMGTIQADSVVNIDIRNKARIKANKNTKKKRGRNDQGKSSKKLTPLYEDSKPTVNRREELLKEFGFISQELDLAENERKLLRMEYSHWTQASDSNRNKHKPSALFSERVLADSRQSPPDASTVTATATATATDASTSGEAATAATTTVAITPTTVTTTTTTISVTTTIGGDSTTSTTTTME